MVTREGQHRTEDGETDSFLTGETVPANPLDEAIAGTKVETPEEKKRKQEEEAVKARIAQALASSPE